jgi:hypothetical protein
MFMGIPSWLLSARTIVSLSSSLSSKGRMRATTRNCQYASTTGKGGGEGKWESAVGKRGEWEIGREILTSH